jgi:dTDP-D-glucose 4,6-dehydratase
VGDIAKARELLGWEPRVDLETGMRETLKWAENSRAEDLFDKASKELRDRKLI